MSNLINCPTCDHAVSSDAQSCPGCGHKLNDSFFEGLFKNTIFIVLGIVGIIAGVGMGGGMTSAIVGGVIGVIGVLAWIWFSTDTSEG